MTRNEKLAEIQTALDVLENKIEQDDYNQGYTSDYNLATRDALETVYDLTKRKCKDITVAWHLKKTIDQIIFWEAKCAYIDVIVWCDKHLWGLGLCKD